jgi:hypothetical protein
MNDEIEKTASHIVDSAVKIHTAFGPGLLESAYQRCMIYELRKRGVTALRQSRRLENREPLKAVVMSRIKQPLIQWPFYEGRRVKLLK